MRTQSRPEALDMSDKKLLIAYELFDRTDTPLTTAPVDRDWMDASPQRFAYRCLPLAIANQAGWWLPSPATFTAWWDGGPHRQSVHVEFEVPGRRPVPVSPWSFSVD